MVHPVLTLARNNLSLTQRLIRSVGEQDVPTSILVIDNDSSDGTHAWCDEQRIMCFRFSPQLGVSAGWNWGLNYLFRRNDRALVVNNDAQLPRWFLRELLGYNVPFVTGIAVNDPEAVFAPEPPPQCRLDPHPDFSAFLIRKEAWETVGPFNEDMKLYASDCAWHVEAHRKGVDLWKANAPFLHESSATLKFAPSEERSTIEAQANADRAVFRELYGCTPGELAYEDLFK